MDLNKLMSSLAALTGNLIPTVAQNEKDIELLQIELIRHLINETSETHTRPFSFDNMDDFTLEGLEANAIERIKRLIHEHSGKVVKQEADTSFFRIFRREVPVISSQVRGSIPLWARGALPEKTLGPFIGINGRRFWFDFFRIIKLFPVFAGTESTPSLLVPLRIQLFQTSKRIYTIPAGSVWIRSNRIAQTAAGNLYTGLTIKGGQLEFSIDTPLGADKIAVVGNTTISLRLDLAQPVINDVSPDEHGVDVKNANLQLPEKFSLQFSSATASIITVSDGSWNLYGTPCRFTFDAAKASFWEPALNRVLVPFNCDQADFEILSCQSPFIQLEGSASIIQSAWALTAATININNPPAAAGIGAIAVQCSKGISNSWTGLKDNNLYERAFVHFTSAWFMLEPGRIAITDLATANLHAKQLYKLWTDELENDEDKERRSTIELTFNKAFPLIYNAYQKGDEAIITQANSSANIDRPVKTNGDPFELRSKNSWYMLSVNQLLQLVSIYDDNILIDTKKPGEDIPTFTASAIALHNALFLVSPVAGFGLFGELLDENTFERGILATSHGLLSYLPTLPDPYAANIGFLRRQRGTDDVDEQRFNTNSYNSLLVAMIGWPAPGALKPNPVLSFHFAPIPQPNVQAVVNADSFRIHGAFTDPASPELQGINIDSIKNKRVAKRLVGHVNTFADFNLAQNDRSEFIPEVSDFFSLVDVSTNADWMGISFGLTDDNFIFRRTHIPNPAVPEGNPLKINGLDVVAPGKFVRAYTTPLISWEPVFNISPPPQPPIAPPVLPLPLPLPDKNPPVGFLFFENDGGPTRIFNTSIDLVSLAPIPLTKYIVDNAKNQPQLPAWSIFTLPYGIRSLGIFYKDSFFYNSPEGPNNGRGAKIAMNSPEFINEVGKTLTGGIQLKITGAEHPSEGKVFEGASYQYSNIVSITGTPTNKSILGTHVTHIFNSEFGRSISVRGVPLERMDLSGYGANIFSNWLNPNAAFGKTSQARFDVFKGRTAHEVIQVKSIIYPWAIRVVRTITIYRTGSAYTFRHDSGWIAESDGVYDFSNWVYPEGDFTNTKRIPSPYIFHPGIIKGVYNVKNIVENELLPFTGNMQIAAGQNYVHEITGEERPATAAFSMNVLLAPVYFDANILIDFVTEGKVNDKVPSKKMLGYVQLNPLGQPISPTLFKNLLLVQQGSLGGPVDCLVNIANSKQKMRINRADVNASIAADNITPVFASAVKGTVVLPKDGSWSIVKHTKVTDEITPVTDNNSIPLLKEGILSFGPGPGFLPVYPSYNTGRFKIANPEDLVKNGNDAAVSYAFLQNTDTQKVLFKNPEFELNQEKLLQNIQSKPKLADAYRLLNSPGIFPKLKDVHDMDLGAKDFEMNIIDKGYKLLNKFDPVKKFEQTFPIGPWYIVKEEKIKIYIEYAARNRDKVKLNDGVLNFDIDSEASKWLNKMNDITMVVDLLTFERLMLIRGKFDAEKGKQPSFIKPELEFGKDLDPAVKILRILAMLSFDPDYKEILQNGLKIVMSNSPENWEYKFQADKEIPVLKFPPVALDGPTTPLRLEAGLKIGCYFNMALPLPPSSGITTPTAGAFVEFYGKLSVMCVSLAAATIYAVGTVRLRLSADTKAGPMLDMKFAFGVELMVGLPVIGNVSVTYGVGVEMHFDSNNVLIGALIFFRGRAELIGGLITVTIYIEASGKIERSGLMLDEGAKTNCIAQVTFALDISICFVIDISFEEKWQESKQIA